MPKAPPRRTQSGAGAGRGSDDRNYSCLAPGGVCVACGARTSAAWRTGIVNNVKTARAACNKCGRAQAYLDAIAALPGKPVVPSTTRRAPAPATTHLTRQPPVSAHHPPVSTIPTPVSTAQPLVSAAAPPVSAPQPPVAAAAPTAPIPNPLAITSLLNPAPISALLNPAPIPTRPTRAAAIAGAAAAAAAAAAPTLTTGDEEEGYVEMAQEELAALEEEEGHWRALGKLVRETCGSTTRQVMKAHTTPLFEAHRARLAAAKQKAEEVRAFTPASDDADDEDEEYTSVESSLPHSESVSSYGSTSGGDETAGSELWEEEDYAFA
ncbi:uncharacterized protein EV422DRAFT_604418 [Fimicolochytrium jonesii]|uniref:uncharacterized protein n=1 Tax=Fimicolochytrium jonesii TaxID=1396493 RepID=UPI0022FE4EC3|nr:uncharacterized protein EV422DRAFT_604418 [Fimicolochytrium jonesii]KAI8817342.1 hypothetical protein EV422DRAFT_604418 [Fimicolochytrium jonesii]